MSEPILLSDSQVSEIDECARKASPGPWFLDPHYACYIFGPQSQMIADDGQDEEGTLTRMRGVGANLPLKDNGEFMARARMDVPNLIHTLRVARTERWTCFHCGFETSDPKEAAAHYGDRDDESPLCRTWIELNADGRAREYQSAIAEINIEREENARLRTKVEGLEYRVGGQLSEIHSFKPFRECNSIQQIFNVYDSMEGRALAGEERLQQAERDMKTLDAAREVAERFMRSQESECRKLMLSLGFEDDHYNPYGWLLLALKHRETALAKHDGSIPSQTGDSTNLESGAKP